MADSAVPVESVDRQLARQADALLAEAALDRARELARAGRYTEALDVLRAFEFDGPQRVPALDLAARICAQQGNPIEAERYWTAAQGHDPGCAAAAAGLARLRAERSPMARVGRFPGLVLAGLCLGATVWAWVGLRTDTRQAMAQVNEVRDALAAFQRNPLPVSTMASSSGDPRPGHGRDGVSLPPDPRRLELDIPGVTPRIEGDAVVVSFDEGLFRHGTTLTFDARAKLLAVGKRLVPSLDGISIQVHGYTDDIPLPAGATPSDNQALGLARAAVVIGFLRSSTELPSTLFYAHSTGDAGTPFPNDSLQNRSRNRTVVLKILRRPKG
jgi:flagellar motor protein MotB